MKEFRTFPCLKIVSGGQTGADRAALDFAILGCYDHGGWCPKGRRALDGPIDARYNLQETPKADYLQRNEWNVRDSDATVVFTLTPNLGTGSKKTLEFAKNLGKPSLHVFASAGGSPWLDLYDFMVYFDVKVLNVAGSRGGEDRAIEDMVMSVLSKALMVTGKVVWTDRTLFPCVPFNPDYMDGLFID